MSSKTNVEQTIQALKGDNQELMKENASLKRQIGGFKASNYRYKKQAKNDAIYIKSLKNEVARIKDYVEEKDRVIAGLNKLIANNQNIIQDLKGERDVAIANYDYVCELPWYKRAWFNPNASKNAK